MNFTLHYIKSFLLPCILFAVVASIAMFALQVRDWLLPVLFLLLPFVDSLWRMPGMPVSQLTQIRWLVFIAVILLLLYSNLEIIGSFVAMVVLAALPEEWFFRAYLQKRFGNNLIAVFIVSVLFTLMHFITHASVVAWLVFIPSVFFGWLYKKTDDLVLVVILHALSNLVYYIYLQAYIERFFS